MGVARMSFRPAMKATWLQASQVSQFQRVGPTVAACRAVEDFAAAVQTDRHVVGGKVVERAVMVVAADPLMAKQSALTVQAVVMGAEEVAVEDAEHAVERVGRMADETVPQRNKPALDSKVIHSELSALLCLTADHP
jgi:hypothetical protein